MIFGDLANWEKEKRAYSKVIVSGIEYLRTENFDKMDVGTYEISGYDSKLMYAMVQERATKFKSPALKAENHQQFIDIQYVCHGEEMIGYARQSDDNVVTDDLLEQADAYLYQELSNEMNLVLHAGNYAVFFPDDLHRPGCALNNEMNIKKVVIKIHTSLL